MKFWFILSQKTALHIAVENGFFDIVQLLLLCPKTNVNILYILIVNEFNKIKDQLFKLHSKHNNI